MARKPKQQVIVSDYEKNKQEFLQYQNEWNLARSGSLRGISVQCMHMIERVMRSEIDPRWLPSNSMCSSCYLSAVMQLIKHFHL